jgi:starch-binding outer membrane protein, SusD/RagB family
LSYVFGNEKAGVPILDVENPLNYDIPRTVSVQINYDFIAGEFTKAAELLPYFNELTTVDYGRAHKTAALAYLAKTYLFAKNWPEAEKAAAQVIDSKKHELLPVYSDVFKITNNWSSEYIWSATSNKTLGSMLPGVMLENKGWGQYNGWGYFQPTKELYDAYEAGDTRREATILKFGDKFTYFGNERDYASTNSQTGYQFNKYMDPFRYAGLAQVSANGDYPTTNLNVPLMRYAEVLLIAAEAKLMQGKSADTELNAIRNRSNLDSKSGMTMDDLKKERRCELAGEFSDRHYDLVRWGDAKAVYSQPKHTASGAIAFPARPQFNPAIHNVWPIPPSEINASKGVLTQNEGW